MATKPIPDGYRTATPYLIIKGAADAIEFYKRAFGATELLRMADPQGRVGHAEIKIGDSVIMLAEEHPAMGYRGPRSLGGSSVSILLYLEDVDAVFERAVKAGARAPRPGAGQFYGALPWRAARGCGSTSTGHSARSRSLLPISPPCWRASSRPTRLPSTSTNGR